MGLAGLAEEREGGKMRTNGERGGGAYVDI